MANVDPFIQPIPASLQRDPETRAYYEYLNRFLHDLWRRTGGGDDFVGDIDVDLTEIREDISENTGDIETNASNIATNASNIATNTRNIATNASDIDSLESDVAELIIAAYYIPVSTSVNYTANDFEFINAKSGATITLPETPNDYSAVIIRNGDGSNIGLDGNKRLINGQSTGKIQRKGTSIVLQYFLDDNEWFAR
jgi:hypothetical protein